MSFYGIYKNRRVLVTGNTGFKGSWLCTWLLHLGAEVAGLSIDIPTIPSNYQVLNLEERIQHYQGDIRDRDDLVRAMDDFQPEVVFHLAAQAILRRSYEDPTLTFETNILGTMNVLECMRQRPSIVAGVIITSDKCYRNVEWLWGYRENDVLGGGDPYSASKACAELVSRAYIESYFQGGEPRVATTRAGNVVGGGDWATDRIVPDCVRAWSQGRGVEIRNPGATRPWQHVLEPLSGYLWLGTKLWQGDSSVVGESFNFGPEPADDKSVGELITALIEYWPDAAWYMDENSDEKRHESTLLRLCCDKALTQLGWRPVLSFADAIRLTSEWYRTYYNEDVNMYDYSISQLQQYETKAHERRLPWIEEV
jgi:CDP-glucose 4,6-dehydratase